MAELSDDFDEEEADDSEEGGVADDAELALDVGSELLDEDDDIYAISGMTTREKNLSLSIPQRTGSVILR